MPLAYALSSQEALTVAQLARVAAAGVLLAFLLVAALHLLSRELNPITRAMSDYVHSRHGALMSLVFAALGSSLFALAEAFRHIALSGQQLAGSILLAIAGAATLLAGIFPSDNLPVGGYNTARGAVHAVAGFLLSPLLVGAMLALSAPWNRVGDDSLLQMIAQGSAAANALAWVALVVVNSITLRVGGLGQRVFMGLVCGSLLLTSIRLLMLASANS